jgi:hypothetical protein
MDPYHVTGQFRRQPDGALEGWCWSPDRPDARLVVEIIADATVVCFVRADSDVGEIVPRGVGDGRHAFIVRPGEKTIPGDATLLSAREAGTGRIFGRLRLRAWRAVDPRFDQFAASLDALRAQLPRPDDDRTGVVRAGFAMVGARLACPSDGRSGAAGRLFARAHPAARRTVQGAPSAAPKATIVLWARRAEQAAAAATTSRPAAPSPPAELFIVDSGHDPRASLLPTIIRDATFLNRPGGCSLDAALWSAASEARGGCLVLIDGDGAPLSAAMLSGIIDRIHGARIVVHPAIAKLVRAIGEPTDIELPPTAGFLFAVDRGLFERVGGFDPAMSADSMLAVADFCLRAALLGARPVWPTGLAPGPVSARRVPAPAALALFRRRWGQLSDADVS